MRAAAAPTSAAGLTWGRLPWRASVAGLSSGAATTSRRQSLPVPPFLPPPSLVSLAGNWWTGPSAPSGVTVAEIAVRWSRARLTWAKEVGQADGGGAARGAAAGARVTVVRQQPPADARITGPARPGRIPRPRRWRGRLRRRGSPRCGRYPGAAKGRGGPEPGRSGGSAGGPRRQSATGKRTSTGLPRRLVAWRASRLICGRPGKRRSCRLRDRPPQPGCGAGRRPGCPRAW